MIWKIVLGVMIFVAWFGVLGPNMISSKSDILVILWPVLTLVGFFFIIKKIWSVYVDSKEDV